MMILLCRYRMFRKRRITFEYIFYYISVYLVLNYALGGLNTLLKRFKNRISAYFFPVS